MPTRLTQEDRNAIDLLLDKNASGFAGQTVAADRLRAAEKVLNVLGVCPADEPGADLVAKTMRRIDGQVAPMRTTTMGTSINDGPLA